MSVVTKYEMEAETDIVSRLEEIGALTRSQTSFAVPKYRFDEKGIAHRDGTELHYRADLDLSKLWPEDWAEYSAEIFERGVLNVDTDILNRLDDYCVGEYLRTQMERPVPVEGRTFSYYGKDDGKWGYFTENKAGTPGASEFIPFEGEELAEIMDGAEMLAGMWKLTRDRSGELLRRDLTDYEKAKIPVYHVLVTENGTGIFYWRNYAHGIDDAVPDYVAHCLSDERIHLSVRTEGTCNYDGFSENGKFGPNLALTEREREEAVGGTEG